MFQLVAKHLGDVGACFQGAFDIPFIMINTGRYLREREAIFGADAVVAAADFDNPFDLSLDAAPPKEMDE